jgi:hypothetical protein
MTQISNTIRQMIHAVSKSLIPAIAFGLWLVLVPAVGAQVLYGTLSGTVTDASKAAVPNTQVTVMDQGTGATRQMTTNGQGEFVIGDLPPGTYSVIINQTAGFSKYTQQNIVVSVNQQSHVDITLQLASVSSEVTISTAAPLLQTQDAEVNHNITQSQLASLPVTSTQGRNFQALYTLIPGAANVVEQNSTASNPSRAMSLNVNGVEDMGNTTRIDGAINTYGWLPYLIAYVPPADSIQTINIATNSFNAEQGMAGGASVNVIIKSGTRDFHGSVWEYNQIFNTNARAYTQTVASFPRVPKNIFNQFGFSIGGPVYIPKILTSKSKLFFFDAFERTTRRQLITNLETVPTTAMLTGDFSAVSSITTLYDPLISPTADPTKSSSYAPITSRKTFLSEYGCNCIPASRQFPGSAKLLSLLQPISATVTNPNYSNQLLNDYNGSGTLAYNRNTNDAKVTYIPTDATSIFGRYSIEPFNVLDPQSLGQAGGPTFDGGQAGAASGRIQNVGLGMNHVLSARMVIDADFGYTRQVTGAQSTVDIAAGDFGLNTLMIPGTNGIGPNYVGQPTFAFCNSNTNNAGGCFTPLGNSQGANPFLFRDNQYTADINFSWITGRHATKYGFTYYHFQLNHFQPTSGANINSPRGGFQFQGALTTNTPSGTPTGYNALADMLLGLPNSNSGNAIAHPYQLANPNALRWSQFAFYAQDQWSMSPKLTLNYGLRYEYYPAPYRDHTGVSVLDPTLPQSGNVIIGGVGGNPENAGIDMGWGQITPRFGIAYSVTDRTVLRGGFGLTTDPDSLRFLRDSFPVDQAPAFTNASGNGTVALNTTTGTLLPLTVGIPNPSPPNLSTGIVSLPVSSGTTTVVKNYRRGYIESWNLFFQQDLGASFVANIGYVGTHQVRQLAGYSLNAAPLPSGATPCMPNGQYNPSTGLSGPCAGGYAVNQVINTQHCPATACYNTGGITQTQPLFSSNYNGLQAQLTRNAGRVAQVGLVYTWSHAFDYADNGAGSGSGGVPFSYPAYFFRNRASAGYDRTNNFQFWWIYHLPFGSGQKFATSGWQRAIFGGFQLNGQVSHISGAPFSVGSNAVINAPNNPLYADLVLPYHQRSGHAQSASSGVSSGMPWFDPTSFADPAEPQYTNPNGANYVNCSVPSCMVTPHFGNTHRNQFRGPGVSLVNASIFRGFHIYRETEFQVRVEAFNLFNHAILPTPNNVTVGGAGFGYITSGFGASRSLQFSGRFNF